MEFADIKAYLHGLLVRDCEAMSAEEYAAFIETPEGQEWKRKADDRQAAYARGDLKMFTFSGGGTIKILELTREHARQIVAEHGRERCSDELIAFAEEG